MKKTTLNKYGLLAAIIANAFIAIILEADLPMFTYLEFKGMFSVELTILVSFIMLAFLIFVPSTRNFSYWLIGLIAVFIIATIAEWGEFFGGYFAGLILTMLIYVYESFIYAGFLMFDVIIKAAKQAKKEKRQLSMVYIKRQRFPAIIFINLLAATAIVMWFG